jgi:hypothetical protein
MRTNTQEAVLCVYRASIIFALQPQRLHRAGVPVARGAPPVRSFFPAW